MQGTFGSELAATVVGEETVSPTSSPRTLTSSTAAKGQSKSRLKRFQAVVWCITTLTLTSILVLDCKYGNTTSFRVDSSVDQRHHASYEELKALFSQARNNYEHKLQEEYGNYTASVFQRSALFKQITSNSNLSVDRLKRRLQIKVIQAQLKLQSDIIQGTRTSIEGEDLTATPVNFVFGIGGPSTAAGHGNLHSQSYGAVLETSLQPIFEALGIHFYAKNYARSGVDSGPQFAMCMHAIFGNELDIVSWDFAITDGRRYSDYELYAQRAGMHPGKPILFSFNPKHKNIDHYLEPAGMARFIIAPNVTSKFPHSDHLEELELLALPRGVRYFHCKNDKEMCLDHKWNTSAACPHQHKVMGQVGWHVGWKDHLLKGHLLAAFLIESIVDALDELDNSATDISTDPGEVPLVSPSISKGYLDFLLSLEATDHETFLASPIPQNFIALKEKLDPKAYQLFHRSNALCHMADLPTQARFDGLVTENMDMNITYLHAGKTTYNEEGAYARNAIPEPSVEESLPWLTYNPQYRDFLCEFLRIDSNDAFMIRHEDQWMTMVVPNNAENEVFSINKDWKTRAGLIVICGQYFPDFRLEEPINTINLVDVINTTESDGGIKVNGVTVTGAIDIDDGKHLCHVLQHQNGIYFPTAKHLKGQYEIKIRVGVKKTRLYFSAAFVL